MRLALLSGTTNIYGDEALAGWKKVVDAVHEEGGKIVPQLWHVGSVRKAGTEPYPEVPGYGPSDTLKNGKEVCHEMSKSGMDTSFKNAEPASLDTLLARIDRQEFDLVAVGRALIANPHWPRVVQEQGIEGLKAYEKEMLSTLA
jgi:2,4-dienoyl-CoA reductase-like NADH-dependent reductase (Old Yellow Enzyme family)